MASICICPMELQHQKTLGQQHRGEDCRCDMQSVPNLVQVHALTEALSLATERLAAASIAEKSFASGELKMAKVLHAAAAEVDVQRWARC